MFLGRYQSGSRISLSCQCRDSSWLASAPDSAPTATIYGSSDTPIVDARTMPPKDRTGWEGGVELSVLLMGDLADAGHYTVRYEAVVDGVTTVPWIDTFEVVPGGGNNGTVIAMYPYHTPAADFVLAYGDTGKTRVRRNPRLKA